LLITQFIPRTLPSMPSELWKLVHGYLPSTEVRLLERRIEFVFDKKLLGERLEAGDHSLKVHPGRGGIESSLSINCDFIDELMFGCCTQTSVRHMLTADKPMQFIYSYCGEERDVDFTGNALEAACQMYEWTEERLKALEEPVVLLPFEDHFSWEYEQLKEPRMIGDAPFHDTPSLGVLMRL